VGAQTILNTIIHAAASWDGWQWLMAVSAVAAVAAIVWTVWSERKGW